MLFHNRCHKIIIFILLHIALLQHVFAGDVSLESDKSKDKSGVFILSADEFKGSSEDLAKILKGNGVEEAAIRVYAESSTFGFKEFRDEVIKHSSNLSSVMMIFNFHGADAGGCLACDASTMCLQGNLCAENDRYISANQIVDDFISPLDGKKIALFFKSCFSGHLAKKVEQLASKKVWQKPTPIVVIASDNNEETAKFLFPSPDYSRKGTTFCHWKDINCASMYEKMENFFDFVHFVNSSRHNFKFTVLELNDGKNIGLAQFGFKDLNIRPAQELEQKNGMYKNIEEKLRTVDVSNLTVLIVETERMYENLKYGDMWLNAFEQNGVSKKNIHWIKPLKTGEDLENPQIHGIFDNFDFINPQHKVLIFVRGDDNITKEAMFGLGIPNEWHLILNNVHVLSAERISALLLSKLAHKVSRVLVFICSPNADFAFEQLISNLDIGKATNVAIVSFYSPERKYNLSKFGGWPMGFLAPLYSEEFLFFTAGGYQDAFPNNSSCRETALTGLKLFEKMASFYDYLEFLQYAEACFISKHIAVKTHNIAHNDLRDFGFLPRSMPKSWDQW